jgi:hypothetical protein
VIVIGFENPGDDDDDDDQRRSTDGEHVMPAR